MDYFVFVHYILQLKLRYCSLHCSSATLETIDVNCSVITGAISRELRGVAASSVSLMPRNLWLRYLPYSCRWWQLYYNPPAAPILASFVKGTFKGRHVSSFISRFDIRLKIYFGCCVPICEHFISCALSDLHHVLADSNANSEHWTGITVTAIKFPWWS